MDSSPGGSSGADLAVGGGTTIVVLAGIAAGSQSSQAAPVIAGIVALAVALITWYATDRRQGAALAAEERRHQATLEAERERFTEQLKAESSRHEAVLRHQERQQDIDELRRILDNAAAVLAELNHDWLDFIRARWRVDSASEDPDVAKAAYRTAREQLARTRRTLVDARYRASMRLGTQHEAVRALGKLEKLMREGVKTFPLDLNTDQRDVAMAKVRDEARLLTNQFQAAASEEIGVRRDSPSQGDSPGAEPLADELVEDWSPS